MTLAATVMDIRKELAEIGVREALIANRRQWERAYPGVDLDREVEKMVAWMRANPSKRPKKLFERFAVNWLNKIPNRQRLSGGELTMRNVERMFRERDERDKGNKTGQG